MYWQLSNCQINILIYLLKKFKAYKTNNVKNCLELF